MSIHNIDEIKKVYEKLNLNLNATCHHSFHHELECESFEFPSGYTNIPTKTAYTTTEYDEE